MKTAADYVSEPKARKSRPWIWVFVAFLVQLAAWTAWFVIAAHNRVEEVPLSTHR